MYLTFSTKDPNGNNDISIGDDGNLAMLTGAEAVGNVSVNCARTQLGELPLAFERGVPYFQTVFYSGGFISVFLSYLAAELARVSGVDSIRNLEHNVSDNILKWEAHLSTTEGDISVNG